MKKPQLPTNLSENLDKLGINKDKASKLLAEILDMRKKTKLPVDIDKEQPNAQTDASEQTAKQTMTSHDHVAPLRLVFLGGGSFGTAMANMAAKNGCDSTLWVRNKRSVKQMQKHRINKKYLPNHQLDETLKFSNNLAESVKDKDIIFVAVPSSAFREMLQNIAPHITGQAVVSLTKGMEKDTFALMSDIITQELPEVSYGVMSGPNLAKEIMDNMPSGTVIASESEQLRHAVQMALHSAFFRVFASEDVRGVELGGALKNIYAIAMGMAATYDVGENTKAMILTRALAEMSRFGVHMGANPLTFLGLSGVGDLYATCGSELSRNFRIGKLLAQGVILENATKSWDKRLKVSIPLSKLIKKPKKTAFICPLLKHYMP